MAKKKEEMGVPAIVDSVETLEAKMKAMREAQKEFAKFSQEQVDKIFYEAAMAPPRSAEKFSSTKPVPGGPFR